jgi:hypothetical protein
MNNTHGSTPPNPTPDLPNRSTDLHKSLGIVETPHEESIAKFMPIKSYQIKRNRRNPAKNSSKPRTPKTPKSSPSTHGFGRRIKGKRTTKGSHEFPPIKSPRARSRKHTKKTTKRGLRKSPPRATANNTTKPCGTTPNHLYKPRRFILSVKNVVPTLTSNKRQGLSLNGRC